jgi:hypothetical protein
VSSFDAGEAPRRSTPSLGPSVLRIVILYRDADGSRTDREISDVVPLDDDSIEAYCCMRNGRRTFRVSRITRASNFGTGEVVANPWQLFGLAETASGTVNPISVVGPILPAVLALKHFSKNSRGFAKRERDLILQFVGRNVSVGDSGHRVGCVAHFSMGRRRKNACNKPRANSRVFA